MPKLSLSSGINNSTTTIPVASAAVFPTPDANNKFFATLDDSSNVEVVLVTAISSNNLTVVRAQDNTSAAAFGSGTKIELRLTAKVLETGTTSLSDLDGDTKIQLEESSDEDKIRFDTAGTERMAIYETGDVAIGPNGSNPFGISYTGTDFAISEATGTASVQIDGGDAARMDFGVGSTALFRMYTDTSNFTEFKRTTDHPIIFNTNNTEILRILSTELKLASGKKLVGGASNVDFTIQSEHRTEIIGANKGTVILKDQGTAYALFERPTGTSDFDIQNPISDGDITFVGNDGGTTITALTLDMSDAGAAIFNNSIRVGQSTVGNLLVDNNGNTVEIKAGRDGTHNVDLSIYTQKSDGTLTEYIRVQGDGKVGIGTVAPATDGYSYAQDLVIKAGASASDGAGLSINSASRQYGVIAFGDSAATNSGEIFYDHTGNALYFKTSAVSRWSLDSGGNMVATGNVTAYGTPSDIKLKEDINIIENAVDKVKQLQGITYTLKSDGNRLTGLIAQDLEKVLPEAVYTTKTIADEREGEESEEHLAIRYGNTVGLLVEAIKELSAKIEKLENK